MTDKELWFKKQCEADEELSSEDIIVFGEYATNKDGDFLYSVKQADGSYKMNSVFACDLLSCESIYPEWLMFLMEGLEENYQDDSEIKQKRSQSDRKDIARCFKEAICRNEFKQECWREELRKKPAMGVYFPAVPIEMRPNDCENCIWYGMYPGLWNAEDDTEHVDENGFSYNLVEQPDEVKKAKGYRFATKVVEQGQFIQIFGYISSKDQHGPFRMLADLEECVNKAWAKGEVRDTIRVKRTDDRYMEFTFSHFEIECEPDERFRTIFVVYSDRDYV